MTTAVVLFTRDLRIHDQPALTAACDHADRVVPLFVLHDRILTSRYAAPNRVAHLLEALHDLRRHLDDLGATLVVRHGALTDELARICTEVGADDLHLSADVSGFAQRREAALGRVAHDLGMTLHTHPGVTLVPPGDVTPASSDHFRVFTPYWRQWVEQPQRDPLPAPTMVPMGDLRASIEPGRIPALDELVDGAPAPDRLPGGETVARARLDVWFDGPIGAYDDGRNRMAIDGTSRLSAHLHVGTLSVAEVASRVDRRRAGHDTFLQELCWRDYNHQLLAARPDMVTQDFRTQGDRWRDEPDAVEAWKQGRTGYPIVDAGMRQLLREGFMHNRARMIVASFLTKHLRIDWRVGAWHFMDHLEDGDLANNFAQWQWTAGTGTDSRPNRMFNPVTQSQRYDPDGTYIRRYVPELADLDDRAVHAPWETDGSLFGSPATDYPPPLVDHAEARERFLTDRGR